MEGKRCIVTGANSGIGEVMARDFARRGAEVVMVCRNVDKGEEVRKGIVDATGNPKVDLVPCDLSDLDSVNACAERLLSRGGDYHVLMNNAGIYLPTRAVNARGHELMFATNHLGPFLLTRRLLPKLEGARVVTTSSMGHKLCRFRVDDLNAQRRFLPIEQYGVTKLCNILFARELARREGRRGIISHAYHPGPVATGFAQDEPGLFGWAIRTFDFVLRSPARGARTGIYLATSPKAEEKNGEYWIDEKVAWTSPAAKNRDLALELWRVSELMSGVA
jgi:NAD(P)-dependent dehydrogenase (short-subunit alcohol dehydrogenase family)